MADKRGSARRTNRALSALVTVVIVISGAVAFGTDNPAQSPSGTNPTDGPAPVGTGSRPAETSLSWFDHSMSVEQFDYDMKALSCRSVAEAITPDVCAVASSPHGDFMLVGSEGFWDPTEIDSEGFAHVALNFSVFTMRKDQGSPRAVSVLDGTVDERYSKIPVRVDVFTATIGESEVLVLHKHLSDSKADAYSSWDEVQVLTASSTGAPTVVATYRGAQLHVAATPSSILLSNLRYRASSSSMSGEWYSRVTLTPTESSPIDWTETLTSSPEPVTAGNGMTLVDTYQFPHRESLPAPAQA